VTYIFAVLALNTTPPPEMRLIQKELEQYSRRHNENYTWILSQIYDMKAFMDTVRTFYSDFHIHTLYQECKPWYIVL